jgi:hypothetical protein
MKSIRPLAKRHMTSTTDHQSVDTTQRYDSLLYVGVLLLALPFLLHGDFDFHRDELLYLTMGDHLAWGYLEVPPISHPSACCSFFWRLFNKWGVA